MKGKILEQAAIPPEVPGIGPGRRDKTLHEETLLAFEAAYKAKPKVIVVKDINAAAFVEHKGFRPTVRMKGSEIYFVFPDNDATSLCLDVYKANPSITLAESVAALHRLEAEVAAMRAQDKEKGGSVKMQ
jgi:hypothetical protein